MPEKRWHGAAELRSRLVPLDSLEPFPDNPRRGDVKAIGASLRRFGQLKPIVVNGSCIIAGHHIVLAAYEECGWSHVAVVDGDFSTEEEARAFLLADNRTSELGESDQDALAAQLAGLSSYEGTGYSEEEVAVITRLSAVQQVEDEEVWIPDPEAVLSSRLGEVYELGAHRLVCGDARDPAVMALAVDGESVDLLFTDPPYGVAYQHELSPEEARRRRRRTDGLEVAGDALSPDETRGLVADVLRVAKATMPPGASFYVCAPPGPSALALALALADAGLDYRQQIAWVKDRFVLGRSDYHYRHEAILYGWLEGAAHRFFGGRTQDSVWEIARPGRSDDHPTTKPVELVARAIRNSSMRGEIILDPFAGSGTTLIAGEQEGRRARLIEIDARYCDVVRRRYAAFVGDESLAP